MDLSKLDFVELRNWLLFVGAILGSIIALKSLFDNTRQRKLENTFKLLSYLREHISKAQIDTFIRLFHANNECAGVPINEFHFDDHQETVEDLFSEGGSGNGDLQNMIEIFDLISTQLLKGTLAEELIWYEYGQIMSKCRVWMKILNKDNTDDNSFYTTFLKYMNKNEKKLSELPIKHYTYLE